MATLASDILNAVSTILLDPANVRWTQAELLGWLNDGQRQITMMVPESTSLTRTAVQLVAGTEQTIPADGWMLIDVYRNMGTNGATPGAVIRLVDRKMLDAFQPTWHSDPPTSSPSSWVFDPQSVTNFWVYPPNDGTGWAEINYSQIPADVTTTNQPITLNGIFETALIDYILFRACSKEAEYSPGPDKAKAYWDSFQNSLMSKTKAEIINDPNQQLGKPPPDEAGVER